MSTQRMIHLLRSRYYLVFRNFSKISQSFKPRNKTLSFLPAITNTRDFFYHSKSFWRVLAPLLGSSLLVSNVANCFSSSRRKFYQIYFVS